MQGARFPFTDDWRARLNTLLPKLDETDKDEVRARQAKAAALAELAASRFSVLVGPAGSGKTTVLKALCQHEHIAAKSVLLLAPTGKARVQLAQKCGHDAQTLAQFLASCGGRYDGGTSAYKTVVGSVYIGCKTIIVDEASMLTEDKDQDHLVLANGTLSESELPPEQRCMNLVERRTISSSFERTQVSPA